VSLALETGPALAQTIFVAGPPSAVRSQRTEEQRIEAELRAYLEQVGQHDVTAQRDWGVTAHRGRRRLTVRRATRLQACAAILQLAAHGYESAALIRGRGSR